MIAFACIAPHGDVDSPPELHAAMQELGRRFEARGCDAAVVVTPHNVHVEGHYAVVTAARVGTHETDTELAGALVGAIRTGGLPVVGVSFGGNDESGAEHPLDWGTEIPLEYVQARRVVVVAPARDRPLDEHIHLGELIASATGDRRVALVASADHAHAHDAGGPYGYDEAAARYDERFLELLGREPLDFRPLADLVEPAKADSLWQLLVLQGAAPGRADLLAYAAPTYYGTAVATVG